MYKAFVVDYHPKADKMAEELEQKANELAAGGRKSEQDQLLRCAKSKMPEFMVIYGRRRVGKTFLIRGVFKNDFTFYTSRAKQGTRKDKVTLFHKDIVAYGGKAEKKPESWFDAFDELKDLLKGDCHRNAVTGKKIVFLDEVPWMDGKNRISGLRLTASGTCLARPCRI